MVNGKELYRVDELSIASGFSEDTIRRWIKHGLLECVHFLGAVRIPRDEYHRILKHGIGKKRGKLAKSTI